jgi:hypothetical protein
MAAKFCLKGKNLYNLFNGKKGEMYGDAWNSLTSEQVDEFFTFECEANEILLSTYCASEHKGWELKNVRVWLSTGIIKSKDDQAAIKECYTKGNQFREVHTWVKDGKKHRENNLPATIVYDTHEYSDKLFEEWFLEGERKRKEYGPVIVDSGNIIQEMDYWDEDEDMDELDNLMSICKWCRRDREECDNSGHCPNHPDDD